jgi:hypothetical protein
MTTAHAAIVANRRLLRERLVFLVDHEFTVSVLANSSPFNRITEKAT